MRGHRSRQALDFWPGTEKPDSDGMSGLGVNQQRVLGFVICKMAAQAGFEPATKWLTATCSTTELLSNFTSGKGEIRGLVPPLSMVFWQELPIGWRGGRKPFEKGLGGSSCCRAGVATGKRAPVWKPEVIETGNCPILTTRYH